MGGVEAGARGRGDVERTWRSQLVDQAPPARHFPALGLRRLASLDEPSQRGDTNDDEQRQRFDEEGVDGGLLAGRTLEDVLHELPDDESWHREGEQKSEQTVNLNLLQGVHCFSLVGG